MPKVSILMPACNVEKFLRECMDSVVDQTLKDIEIICMDDGSRDSTGDILDEYAAKDNRVKVIHKPNSGYGHSMNVGLDHATGEYIGIVETDDYAAPDMFEKLYITAKQNNADMIKSNYYKYKSRPVPENTFLEVLKPYGDLYDRVFCPADHMEVFHVRPCIWSGLYRREMLTENHIRFTETPGASYQDTSFAFKVWASAKRAILVKDAYLHYRVDNENSSVKSAAKIFCLCDEYESTEKFLEERPDLKEKLSGLVNSLKYESYNWNLKRLAFEYRYVFLMEMHRQFLAARNNKSLKEEYFSTENWTGINQIIDDMNGYFNKYCRSELGEYESVREMASELKKLKKKVQDLETSTSLKVGRTVTAVPRKLKKLIK